jgi:hypothetical protein
VYNKAQVCAVALCDCRYESVGKRGSALRERAGAGWGRGCARRPIGRYKGRELLRCGVVACVRRVKDAAGGGVMGGLWLKMAGHTPGVHMVCAD